MNWFKKRTPKFKPLDEVMSSGKGREVVAAEAAMKKIGIPRTEWFAAVQNLIYLNRFQPELLESIIESCVDDKQQSEFWDIHFCKYHPLDSGKYDNGKYAEDFRFLYEVQPIATIVIREASDFGYLSVDSLMRRVQQVNENVPVDDWDYQRARVIAYGIEPNIEQNEDRDFNEFNADIEYISYNLDAVTGILPALAERKTVDRGIIQLLLSSPSQALMEGNL